MFTIKRKPTTPGEILQEEFLSELGISQKQLADHNNKSQLGQIATD